MRDQMSALEMPLLQIENNDKDDTAHYKNPIKERPSNRLLV